MKIAVLTETADGERRVAATPETAKKFIALGATVAVEAGAGSSASIADADYEAVGATVGVRAEVLAGTDAVLGVQGPDAGALQGLNPGALIVAALDPFRRRERVEAFAAAGHEALAMELMPRITRAQSMDILSSQSNLAGYKAVLDATSEYGRALPMMMTAAGTISAARIFIMGVGVAGLQAIATARRLGAIVSATDVRAATREQIESLGAKAIFVENVKGIEGEGSRRLRHRNVRRIQGGAGRARLRPHRQAGHRHHHALIPGRPAPRLITDAQLATMRPGSVVVDLAVEQGGNVEGAVLGASSSATACASSATATCRAASPPTPRRSTRATSTTSSAPSGTRKRGGWCSRRRRNRQGRAPDARRQDRAREAAGMSRCDGLE
jgi:NAD(P) transhydrogenase subunit alpha